MEAALSEEPGESGPGSVCSQQESLGHIGDAESLRRRGTRRLVQAPDPLNRQSLEAMVAALEAGRPIVQ